MSWLANYNDLNFFVIRSPNSLPMKQTNKNAKCCPLKPCEEKNYCGQTEPVGMIWINPKSDCDYIQQNYSAYKSTKNAW